MPLSMPQVAPVDLTVGGFIHLASTPAAAGDYATKGYVDGHAGPVIARGTRSTAGTATTGSAQASAQKCMEVDATLISGHLYRVYTNEFQVFSTVTSDILDIFLTYSIDGTTPVVSGGTSSLMQETFRSVPSTVGAQPAAASICGFYVASSAVTFKVLLAYFRAAGTGSVNIGGGSVSRTVDMFIQDMGTDPGTGGSTNF
jgi:hypothetical protein